MLRRARLDGLERATLPFPEGHVTAWRGAPQPDMSTEMLKGVLKVWFDALLGDMCTGSRCFHASHKMHDFFGLERDMAWKLCRDP